MKEIGGLWFDIKRTQAVVGACGAKYYATGIKIQRRGGEAFEIPVPPIIDAETFDRFLKTRQANKTHPAHHIKHDYLLGGIMYCACDGNRKWGTRTNSFNKNRRGELVERKTPPGVYYCRKVHEEHISPDCPRTIGNKKADDYVWEKVCKAISNPGILIAKAREMVDQLREGSQSLQDEQDRIQRELDALILERQWVITQARRGGISQSDMDYQLGALTLQELTLKRELMSVGNAIDINALEDWDTQVWEGFPICK